MITSGAWAGRHYAVLGLARSGAATVRALLAAGARPMMTETVVEAPVVTTVADALLINLGTEPYTIRHGDRIAQLVVAPVVQAAFALGEVTAETGRGAGGFGSTGVA